MLLAVDAHYGLTRVSVACVGFTDWSDAAPGFEASASSLITPEPYEPGAFYKRELPFLIDLIARVRPAHVLDAILVDGHVWLDAGKPGLGAHLHQALAGAIPVVGVAKSQFRGAPGIEVVRGASRKPLFVTAVGLDAAVAAEHVRHMHGRFRVPTLLRRVDRLARAGA